LSPKAFNRISALLTAAFAAAALAGCTQSDQSSNGSAGSGATGSKTIAVSIQDLQAQFYEDLEAGMKAEATKYSYTVTFVDANRDSARQTSQVELFFFGE
jgi:ABC-type sugar transport system substrate-binding protein